MLGIKPKICFNRLIKKTISKYNQLRVLCKQFMRTPFMKKYNLLSIDGAIVTKTMTLSTLPNSPVAKLRITF